jgi:reverse gyrase
VPKPLVIVESPAKARTIQGILGNGYDVTASVGHVRDLPKSKLGVDVDNDFEPQYIVPREKKDIVNKIREDVARIGNEPGFRKKQFIDRALEPILDTPEEFARFLVEDRVNSGRVVTEAGLQPQ